ncbi:MAG: phosphoadenosine phosphosulfate reductase [Paracoccaceae bacterium]|nr:MAG: phosphoadenosine phosphosulfate reductase [Paracoccaceae bacterium]
MTATTAATPLSIDAADRDGWTAALDAIADDLGHAEPLGPRHRAVFCDDGTTLLVTFEQAETVRAEAPGRLPFGLTLARAYGWSQLCILAEGTTWWRDEGVWRYMDRLVDDAFFEDFDRVLFYGAGPGGYAAAAYSVVAPGAQVLAICPQATLTPALAGWDARFPAARRLDFTGRYGFAPDMTEGAGHAHVVFDPLERDDAMHAALFHRPWVTLLPARRLGGNLELVLRRLGVLDGLIVAAVEGRLDRAGFARALRMRRNYGPYLKRMLQISADTGHTAREIGVCRSVVARVRAPAFRKRLTELTGSDR